MIMMTIIIIIIIIMTINQSLPTRVYHFHSEMDGTDPMCRVCGCFEETVDHIIKTSGHVLTPSPSASLPVHFLAVLSLTSNLLILFHPFYFGTHLCFYHFTLFIRFLILIQSPFSTVFFLFSLFFITITRKINYLNNCLKVQLPTSATSSRLQVIPVLFARFVSH